MSPIPQEIHVLLKRVSSVVSLNISCLKQRPYKRRFVSLKRNNPQIFIQEPMVNWDWEYIVNSCLRFSNCNGD